MTRAQMGELLGPRLKALISKGKGDEIVFYLTIVALSSAIDVRCKNPAINAKHTLSHHVASHLNIQKIGKANTAILLEIVRASDAYQELGWLFSSISCFFNNCGFNFLIVILGVVELM